MYNLKIKYYFNITVELSDQMYPNDFNSWVTQRKNMVTKLVNWKVDYGGVAAAAAAAYGE